MVSSKNGTGNEGANEKLGKKWHIFSIRMEDLHCLEVWVLGKF